LEEALVEALEALHLLVGLVAVLVEAHLPRGSRNLLVVRLDRCERRLEHGLAGGLLAFSVYLVVLRTVLLEREFVVELLEHLRRGDLGNGIGLLNDKDTRREGDSEAREH